MDARKITKKIFKVSILLLLILFAFSCDIEDNTDNGFKTITYLNTKPDGSVNEGDSGVQQRISVKVNDFLTISYPTSKWKLNQGTTFLGWTIESDNDKHIVQDTNNVENKWWTEAGKRIKGIKEDTSLYAVYTKNEPLTLTMLPDGTETGWTSTDITFPPLYYQKTGDVSGKWFYNKECTDEVASGATISSMPKKEWAVKFELNGGRYKDKIGATLPTNDKLSVSFKFEGIKADNAKQFVTSDGVIDLNTSIAEDTTATVFWSQGDGVVLPDAEKDGSVFAGWWLGEQRITSTTYFPPSLEVTLSAKYNDTTKSYIKYTNSANDTQEDIEYITWTTDSTTYDTSIKSYPDGWLIPDAKKFVGWTTDLDKAKSGVGQPEYLSGKEIRVRISDNWPLELYAMYKDAGKFTLTLDNSGATTLPMYNGNELKQLYYQAEGNIGWYIDAGLTTKLSDNATITKPEKIWNVNIDYQNGQATKIEKTTFTFDGYRTDAGLTFINRNGVIQTSEKLALEVPARAKFIDQTKVDLSQNPTREGYAFTGWTLNGREVKDTAYSPQANNTTLVATWIKDAKIIYHNNIQGDSKTLEDKVSGTKRNLSIKYFTNDFTNWVLPSGKAFLGWNTDSKATTPDEKYREGSTITMAETDIDLYAIYGESTVYTLTLNHNEATTEPIHNSSPISSLYYQSTGNIGWYYDKAATLKVQDNDKITNPKKEWEVIFDYNGGKIEVGDGAPDGTVKKISSFEFQGYGEYINSTGAINTSSIITKDETAYALWDNQTLISIPGSNTFSKSGATFNGWRDSSGVLYSGTYTPVDPSLTLTANWVEDITITYINSINETEKDVKTISGLNRTVTIASFNDVWSVPTKSDFTSWSDVKSGGSSSKTYNVGESIELTGNLTLYSIFKEAEVYKLTFNHADDETKKPSLDNNELNVLYYQATGHKDAIGWYKDSVCKEKITSQVITKPEKVWTLTFNANGGKNITEQGKSEFTFNGYSVYVDKDGVINTNRVIHSDISVSASWTNQTSIDVTKTTTRDGYAFRYWTTKNSSGEYVRVRANKYIPSQKDTEFVAEWIKDSTLTYINTVNKNQKIVKTVSGEDRNITIEKIDTSWNWTASSGEFLGWSATEDSSASDKAYNVGTTIQLEPNGDNSNDLTLYAVYGKTDIHELTFDNSDATTKARIVVNNTARDLTTLYYSVKEGSENAWYYDKELKNKIPANAKLSTIPKKVWTVNYNYNGGKGSISKANYEFAFNGFGPYIDKDGKININDGIDTDINVSAMWTEGQARIDLPTPTKTNAIFDKWVYTNDDGEEVPAINPFVPSKNQMQLKAIWYETTRITYRNPNVSSETITNIKEGSNKSETIPNEYPVGWTLQPKKKFIGWSESSTATTVDSKYANGTVINVNENLTLYAVYADVRVYKLEIGSDVGTTEPRKTSDGSVLTAIYYQPEGNVGWYYTEDCEEDDIIRDGDSIIIPQKTRLVYLDVANGDPLPESTIKSTFDFKGYGHVTEDKRNLYIDEDGKFILNSKSIEFDYFAYPNWDNQTYVELPTPTRSGYVFRHWVMNENDVVGMRFQPIKPEMTVRAIWLQNYEIKYVNLPESLNETITTIVYGNNRSTTVIDYPENWTHPNKKEFLGWMEDKTATSFYGRYSPGNTINVSSSVTVYAYYRNAKVYTLTIDNAGATKEPRISEDVPLTKLYYQATGAGKGWYYDEDCTMKVANEGSIIIPEKIWRVTFDIDGGTELESSYAISTFKFGGYTNANKTYVTNEGKFLLSNISIDRDTTITALWSNQSSITLPTTEKEGYTFKEWTKDGKGLGSATTYTPTVNNETLKISWVKNTTIKYIRLAAEQNAMIYEYNGLDKSHKVLAFFDTWILPSKRIFKGWNTNPSAKDADSKYAVGADISVDDDITLYAIYEEAKVYSLIINHMGATQLTTRNNGSLKINVEELYYQENGNKGWYYDSNCTIPVQMGDRLNLPAKIFTVTFDPNGGTSTSTTATSRFTFTSFKYDTSSGASKRAIIDIDGTINIDQKIDKDTSVYAEWTSQSSVLLPDVIRADRTPFVTWSLNDTWIDEGLTEYYPKTNNEVLKAVWFENVSITYQNSENDNEKQQIKVKERNVELIDLPSSWKIPDGKVFVGWSLYASPKPEDVTYEGGETIKLSRSIQLYPIYQEAKYYTLTITYDKDVDAPIKRQGIADDASATVNNLYYHIVGKSGWYFDKSKRAKFYDGKQISVPKKYYSVTQKDGTNVTSVEDNFTFGGIKIEAKVGNYTTLLEFISKDGSVNTSCAIEKDTSVELIWGEQEGITLSDIKTKPTSEPNATMGWYVTGGNETIAGLAGDKFYAPSKSTTIEAKIIDVITIVDPNNSKNTKSFTYNPNSSTASDRTHIFNPKKLEWTAPSGQVIKGFANGTDPSASGYVMYDTSKTYVFAAGKSASVTLYCVYGTPTIYSLTLDHAFPTSEAISQITNRKVTALYFVADKWYEEWFYDKEMNRKVVDGQKFVAPRKTITISFENVSNYTFSLVYTSIIDETAGIPYFKDDGTVISLRDTDKITKDTTVVMNTWKLSEDDQITIPSYSWSSNGTLNAYIWTVNITSANTRVFQPGEIVDLPFNELMQETIVFKPYNSSYSVVELTQQGLASTLRLAIPNKSIYKKYGGTYELPKKGLGIYVPESWSRLERGVYCDGFVLNSSKKFVLKADDVEVFGDASFFTGDKELQVHHASNGVKYVFGKVGSSSGYIAQKDENYKGEFDTVRIFDTWRGESDDVAYSVIKIADNTFNGNTKLKTVSISARVRNIGNSAFAGCTSLESVEVFDSGIDDAFTLGTNAFNGCTKLEYAVIGGKTVSLGNNAFAGCTSFTKIALPQTTSPSMIDPSTLFANSGTGSVLMLLGNGIIHKYKKGTAVFEIINGVTISGNKEFTGTVGTDLDVTVVLTADTINGVRFNNALPSGTNPVSWFSFQGGSQIPSGLTCTAVRVNASTLNINIKGKPTAKQGLTKVNITLPKAYFTYDDTLFNRDDYKPNIVCPQNFTITIN